MQYIRWFEELSLGDVAIVGGKNAALGEMVHHAREAGVPVPDGFALTADAYRRHLDSHDLTREIVRLLTEVQWEDDASVSAAGLAIRRRIAQESLPQDIALEITRAYTELTQRSGEAEGMLSVAVRSSATAEDLPGASFAGQQETFLNVRGSDHVLESVRKVYASLFTDRALVYRHERGFDHMAVAISVGVQVMVRSDCGASGVMFTSDTETAHPDIMVINASYGLGEYVVQGSVDPDEYYVHKPLLKDGFRPLLRRVLGAKEKKLILGRDQAQPTVGVEVTPQDRARFALSDDDVLELARLACALETYYRTKLKATYPLDIEWAQDGITRKFFIVQARPETVSVRHVAGIYQQYAWDETQRSAARVLARGSAIGRAAVRGRARVISHLNGNTQVHSGDIIVTEMTDPDWLPLLRHASGIITNRGGRTCHAAIVSREMGIPAVIGCGDATRVIRDGDLITLDCTQGLEGVVYQGEITYAVQQLATSDLPPAPCKLMVNIGDPGMALSISQLPCDGVGLARIEFIITSSIRVHPMALVHTERVSDSHVRQTIANITRNAASGSDFFVDTLAREVGMIAASFYPRQVVVRFSDFKSNEYRDLLGGSDFEPREENPMLGFRGASRYYNAQYAEAFALECAAIKRVREVMGLANVAVMIPFVRTIPEAKRVLACLFDNGLARGQRGLKVIMMCELPSNVLLIEEFAQLFDGFSIGSNDLTQLVLGVDRDSHLVAELFDESDQAVLLALKMAIDGAHRQKVSISICGQAPSDYPPVARMLVRWGIDTLSLNPDAIFAVQRIFADGND